MSFAGEDQWKEVERCVLAASDRRLWAKSIMQALAEREVHEKWYALGLQRVVSTLEEHECRGKLGEVVAAFRSECESRSTSADRLSKRLGELLDPLRELLKSEEIAEKVRTKDSERIKKELKCCRSKLAISRDAYTTQFQLTEDFVAKIENAATLVEKKRLINSQPMDFNKTMEAATKDYRDALTAYNRHVPRLQDYVSTLLSSLKMQEEERLHMLSVTFQALHNVDLAALEALKTAYQRHSAVFTQNSVMEDLAACTAGIAVGAADYRLEEFVPYQGRLKAFQDLGEASPMISWVGEGMSFEAMISLSDKLEASVERFRARIEQLMRKAWAEDLNEEDITAFKAIVDEQSGRKVWVSYMNAKRASGSFRLTEVAYESVATLMRLVLDACQHYSDISTVRSVLILSQTFHNTAPHSYLQEKILSHPIWRKDSTWDEIVRDGIDSEFEKQRVCGGEDSETEKRNVVYTQLTSFAHVMALFGVDCLLMKRVLDKHSLQHNLSPEERSLLLRISISEDPTDAPSSPARPCTERSNSFSNLPDLDSPLELSPPMVRRSSVIPGRLMR